MIITLNHAKLLPAAQLPRGYENYHIPGAAIRSVTTTCGVLFTQEVTIGNARLLSIVVHTKEPLNLEMISGQPLACVLIGLQGTWHIDSGQFGQQQIKEGYCNLFYSPVLTGSCKLEGKNEFGLLIVAYNIAVADKKIKSFPTLEKFTDQISQKKSFLLFSESTFAGASIMELAYQLVRSSYFPAPRSFHSNQVSSLLSAVCKQASGKQGQSLRFAAGEVEAVHAAKLLIDQNLAHHYTIDEIAYHVRLNRRKLGSGFKEIFGKGLYEYLLLERLTLAKTQLEQSHKPVKHIARMAGYRNTSNFCTAFKKMFGNTPNEYRKAGMK